MAAVLVEMSVKEAEEEFRPFYRKTFTVGFGDREIEVTFTESDLYASQWVREALHEHNKRGRGRHGPLVAGICSFRDDPPGHWSFKFRSRKNGHSICLLSICVFGSRCLLVPIHGYTRRPFHSSVQSFLADRRVQLVGMEIGKLAEKMERDWDFRVQSPAELRPLVEAAFGKDAVARSGTRRGGVGLEELAHVALGGIYVKKKPGRLQCNPWSSYPEEDEEEVMHAAVDAFLACEIGTRSLEVIDGRR